MGRRPRFCPPLLSNRCPGTISPRINISIQDKLDVQGGVQPSKKQRSPCATRPIFISPLSRVLTSPRVHVLGEQFRSPSAAVIELNAELDQDTVPDLYQEDSGTESAADIELNAELDQDTVADLYQEDSGTELDAEFELDQDVIDLCDDSEIQLGQDSGTEVVPDEINVVGRARKVFMVPDEKRKLIVDSLLARAQNGKLKSHDTREVSRQFSVPIRTVQRIWHKGRGCLNRGVPVNVSHRKNMCGRKNKDVDVSILRSIPISNRCTVNDVANILNVSKGKAHKLKKEGVIARVSNTLKPSLTEQNKKDRLKWCLFMVEPESIPQNPIFKELFDYVFIDEKWFFLTQKTVRYYTLPGEELPTRSCKNKNYIPKIMFLTAVARPRFDADGTCTFDGKIGCFPLVIFEPAKRSSVNRPAGTLEMKPIESIKKKVIQQFMIEKVLPAIRAKWPVEDAHKPIYIQQDNASSHVSSSDRIFAEASKEDGFDIRIVCQPANSPDLNVLDLGFFNSIQSIQQKSPSRTTEELVAAVDRAFKDYSVRQANRIFLTLHGCLREIMKIGGGNRYNTPHIKKGVLERQGCLPLQLNCDPSLVQDVMHQINE